ncbi:tannase/feruloyl esterase family alpha/beta hydrolase [Hyphomonas sp.]|uniref:tannase/feruloyl esterase family alpha/beta hydrolase n=1 Tax=Hyphomonas sp. TaxID=87 RepID=UPI0030FA001C
MAGTTQEGARRNRRALASVLLGTLVLAGCNSALDPQSAAPGNEAACVQLETFTLASRSLSLPSNGVRIITAHFIPEGSSGNTGRDFAWPDHCRVIGQVEPVDSTAPPIRFEMALPLTWNEKALMLAGGGFDGIIPPVDQPLYSQPGRLVSSPLERGYVTFGSDSGHEGTTDEVLTPLVDGAFARNDEAFQNYAGDALKKTRDAAGAIIDAYYGRPARLTYIAGGSNGGREALLAISQWPGAFDGALVAYPFWNHGTTTLAFGAVWRRFADPDAYLWPAQQALLYDFVMASCDELDGIGDGLVAHPSACRPDIEHLACRDDNSSKACLSPAQLAAIRNFDSPIDLSWRKSGETHHPGFPVLEGADLRGPQQMGDAVPGHPIKPDMPMTAQFYDQFIRHAALRDEAIDPWAIDPEAPGPWADKIGDTVDRLDVQPTSLQAFRDRGGKLILFQGLADPIVSPRSTDEYWHRLEGMIGEPDLKAFARYYVIPGFGHGAGASNAFQPAWDQLQDLDDWVEHGTAPTARQITDVTDHGHGRTRPLCEFGEWTKYESGDPDSADSYRCVADVGQPE